MNMNLIFSKVSLHIMANKQIKTVSKCGISLAREKARKN